MTSSESDVSDSSDSSEYHFTSEYIPYEGESLVPIGDDMIVDRCKGTANRAYS